MPAVTVKEELINKVLHEGARTTVGDLKRILADQPDDNLIIVANPNPYAGEDALDVLEVNTHWHGAITFETRKEEACEVQE